MREAVEKVKAAEHEAEEIRSRARQKAENVRVNAHREGEKYFKDTVGQAKAAADSIIEGAGRDAADETVKIMGDAELEAQHIRDIQSDRLEAAALKIVKGIMDGL